ncbi:MAG: hypothetical protein AAGA31_15485 [Bacteroidota bacterium]
MAISTDLPVDTGYTDLREEAVPPELPFSWAELTPITTKFWKA